MKHGGFHHYYLGHEAPGQNTQRQAITEKDYRGWVVVRTNETSLPDTNKPREIDQNKKHDRQEQT